MLYYFFSGLACLHLIIWPNQHTHFRVCSLVVTVFALTDVSSVTVKHEKRVAALSVRSAISARTLLPVFWPAIAGSVFLDWKLGQHGLSEALACYTGST